MFNGHIVNLNAIALSRHLLHQTWLHYNIEREYNAEVVINQTPVYKKMFIHMQSFYITRYKYKHNRGFARHGTHPYTHDLPRRLGSFLHGAV